MAKRIKVTNASTFYTIPGSQGTFTLDAQDIDDTVFGQNYKSGFPGLIDWKVTSNGYYKGFAGYSVLLKAPSGASTISANEACSLVTGKTYQVTNTAHQYLDHAFAAVPKDNGTQIAAANIVSIDYLSGTVVLDPAYTVTGPITMNIHYFTMATVAAFRSFSLKMSSAVIDDSTIPEVAANSGMRLFTYGLKSVTLDLDGLYSSSNLYRTKLLARAPIIVEVNPEGTGYCVFRGFFHFTGVDRSGNVGALEEEKVKLVLSVPNDDQLLAPFVWILGSTNNLPSAFDRIINAFISELTTFKVQYLPDGVNGVQGNAVVSDLTISGGLDTMSDFSFTFQGTDALIAIP